MSAKQPNASASADLRELPDPGEATGPVPKLYLAFVALAVALGASYLATEADDEHWIAGDRRSEQLAVSNEVSGQALYQRCVPCHQADGRGVAGVFPPLAGSPWVLEDAETFARILLLGVRGDIEVNGAHYQGVMPSFGNLSDAEIAAVATHVRSSFGNDAPALDETTVRAVRASLGGRSSPWEGGAELVAARGGGDVGNERGE